MFRLLTFALILLPVTLFIGIATFFRLDDANREEALWMGAMNRIRHAYVTMVPAVEALGVRVVVTDTIMTDDSSRARLAREVLAAAG